MTVKLEWHELARADLLAIVDYISDDNPQAAQHLLDEIGGCVARLLDHPRSGRPGRVSGTRELIVQPNYVVTYKISEETVSVLRVLHSAQQWPNN